MTTYVDPNSGAAPQPGGWVGEVGMERGHALPAEVGEDGVEQTHKLNEALWETPKDPSVEDAAKAAEKASEGKTSDDKEARLERVNAMANPKKYLAEADEGDSASNATYPDTGDEEKAVDAKALETQAVNMEESAEDKGLAPEAETEGNSRTKKAPAKKAAAKKS